MNDNTQAIEQLESHDTPELILSDESQPWALGVSENGVITVSDGETPFHVVIEDHDIRALLDFLQEAVDQ